MKFSKAVQEVCISADIPLTPQEICERIKSEYPEHYQTPSHLRNVAKGYYKDADHALLAQIYICVNSNRNFHCDKTQKPMKVSWVEELKIKAEKVSSGVHRLTRYRSEINYVEKVRDIRDNAESYHEACYQASTFSGPSLYFHRRAIETCNIPTSLNHMEYIYATLASWGMHRMGEKGPKMKSFDFFGKSIESLADEITAAQNYRYQMMDEQKWVVLRTIFMRLDVMETSISLVGNSKVMHHLLPNLVPPIDREYTLWYLFRKNEIVSNLESEWLLMRTIIENFFIPVVSDVSFQQKAVMWLESQDVYPWDTSMMKIVDNLVIGAVKSPTTDARE